MFGSTSLTNPKVMPVISEMVHPRGLDFANQRKVVMLRDEGGDAEQDEWNSKRDLGSSVFFLAAM